MAVRYPGRWLQTRRQAAWQCALLLAVLLPLSLWRFTTHPLNVALAMFVLAMAPFVIAFQTWRFLAEQEGLHAEPTAGMVFAFRFLASTPLTFGAVMIILLVEVG